MIEEWRPFADGNYAVSNFGRVKRLTDGRRTHAGRMMKLTKMSIGYYSVGPTINGKNVKMTVHRLVAEAFIGPCPEGHEVNHKDGDKTNNRVDNLEYVTHQENMVHAHTSGLIDCIIHGEDVIASIRKDRVEMELSFGELARRHGVSIGFAYQCCKGNAAALQCDDITVRSKFSPRLTDEDVFLIRTLRSQGSLIRELANDFGMSETHVAYLCNGEKRLSAGGPITPKRSRKT